MMRLILTFIVMVSCTVAGNILLKQGAMVPASHRVVFGIMGIRSALGFSVFLMAGLLYSWLLRTVPLNVAQSFSSIQFVAVILASAVVLAEPITMLRWAGIGFILLGIVIVGASSLGRAPADGTRDRMAARNITSAKGVARETQAPAGSIDAAL